MLVVFCSLKLYCRPRSSEINLLLFYFTFCSYGMMLGSNPFNDVSKIYLNSADFVENCPRSKLQGTIIVTQMFIVSLF